MELERRLLDLLDVLLDLGKVLGELFVEFRLDSHEVRLLSTVQILLTEGKPPLPPVHLRLQFVHPVFKLSDEHHVLGLHVWSDHLDEMREHLNLVGDAFPQCRVSQLESLIFVAESDFVHLPTSFLTDC